MTDYSSVIKTLEALECRVLADEPMAKHTSFRIGGPADLFVTVSNNGQLAAVLELASVRISP